MSSHCLPSCPETCQNSDTSAGTESLGRCRTDSPRKDGPGPEGRSGLELEAGVEDVLHGSVATCPLASSLQGWGGGRAGPDGSQAGLLPESGRASMTTPLAPWTGLPPCWT